MWSDKGYKKGEDFEWRTSRKTVIGKSMEEPVWEGNRGVNRRRYKKQDSVIDCLVVGYLSCCGVGRQLLSQFWNHEILSRGTVGNFMVLKEGCGMKSCIFRDEPTWVRKPSLKIVSLFEQQPLSINNWIQTALDLLSEQYWSWSLTTHSTSQSWGSHYLLTGLKNI